MARPTRVTAGIPAASRPARAELRIPLRLTIARGALGLELYESIEIGPLEVDGLAVTLPNLRFPVDLSGGVRPFRHHRGRLEHLSLRLPLEAFARFLDRRLRELLGGLVRPVSVWRVTDGMGIGLVGAKGALAFDVLWAPVGDAARFVVTRARGAEIDGPALAVALSAVDTAVGRFATRSGRFVTLDAVGAQVVREVMPAVGARAPSATAVRCGSFGGDTESVRLELDRSFADAGYSALVASAVELSELTRTSDDRLARGELAAARDGYVTALEWAPRHPVISQIVAEIDFHAGGRAEAALSMLSDAMAVSDAGTIAALLLARSGDRDGATAALRAATRDEEYGPLAALVFLQQSALEESTVARLAALDEAVARCPALARVRMARFEARLASGGVAEAVADAEHVEAAASGNAARFEICRAAAARLLAEGHRREAGRFFERALRYAPDDPVATAGLGRALLEAGRTDRAVALLERAVALGEARSAVPAEALLDLAKLLARLGDLPQAIARVRQVAGSPALLAESRALEAEWRVKLGDLAGATLAYGRLREIVELLPKSEDPAPIEWLREAARFEWEVRREAALAERHLAVALRLAPRHRGVAEEYREIAAILAAREPQ